MAEKNIVSIRANKVGIKNTNPTSALHIGDGTKTTDILWSNNVDLTLSQNELVELIRIIDPSYNP